MLTISLIFLMAQHTQLDSSRSRETQGTGYGIQSTQSISPTPRRTLNRQGAKFAKRGPKWETW